MVLFYFKLISSLRRQHHFIQWYWMAHSAIAENLQFAYLTMKSMLMWCFNLKFSEPSLCLNWCLSHLGASSGFVTFKNLPSQVNSLLHVNSCCSEGLCYVYSLFVHSTVLSCFWVLPPHQIGHLVKAGTVAQRAPSASFSWQRTPADELIP